MKKKHFLLLISVFIGVGNAQHNNETYRFNEVDWDGFHVDHSLVKRSAGGDESQMTTPELVQMNGYPCEIHNVETKDGFILTMHRIPFGIKSPMCRNKKKPAVLLMHDIISSSSDFIINGPEMSLGYLLADAGFDVWIGNVRGNRYSRKHRQLNPVNMAFWDFTFHEMGAFDLPAKIDYILEETGQESIYYIGHSMGTTIYFVLFAMNPEYNAKIKVGIMMSPVVYLTYMRSPLLRFFAIFVNLISIFFDVIGIGEFLPRMDLMTQFGHLLCKGQDFSQPICSSILFILSGYNQKNLNMTRFPVYMGHTPAGASTKTFMHYGQLVQSGVFKQMDWGVIENLPRYNALKAPRYQLYNTKTPTYLIYSKNDWFANRLDIDKLYRDLPEGVAQMIEVKDRLFAHVDFAFGINAREEVYPTVFDILKRY